MATEQTGQGDTLLGWPKSIYCLSLIEYYVIIVNYDLSELAFITVGLSVLV